MESNNIEAINPIEPNNQTKKPYLSLLYLIKNFFWLFFRPNRFFEKIDTTIPTFAVGICAYVIGITAVADRIDTNILKYYSGENANQFLLNVTNNWIDYWLLALIAGIFSAGIGWLLWGWIFNLRVKWSGDTSIDPTHGRVIHSIVEQVLCVPYLIAMIIPVLYYPDYITFFNHDEIWSSLIIVFAIWAFIAKFLVVIGQFNVILWRAIIFFLVLPISIFFGAVYLIVNMLMG